MISSEEYRERLEECPRYDTPEFLQYLRNNNVVVHEDDIWLVIENCKYHKPDSGYYTAFFKPETKYRYVPPHLILPTEWRALWRIYQRYCDGWEFCIKSMRDRSIRTRFHVHFVEYGREQIRNARR